MNLPSSLKWLSGAVLLLVPAVLIALLFLSPPSVARGKSASLPMSTQMEPEQARAQALALADSRVQALTNGKRSEVFGVLKVGGQYTQASTACAAADCRQVEIYLFDEDAAVIVIVDVDAGTVLDVLHQPGMQPGINARLAERAREIAFSAPALIKVLGAQPTDSDWEPMDASLVGTACESGHLCVAPSFDLGRYILWAHVDLTTEQFVDLAWTATPPDHGTAPYEVFEPGGCPAPGTVSRDGWTLAYETTGTDGLRVFDAAYEGVSMLHNAKLIEWHADYGSSGYEDSTGCGGGGGGYPIYPYGETQVLELHDRSALVGFEVVQDFRMGSWGQSCNYRYEQRFQFFSDGRFRVVGGAYGKGCGTNSIYRPLILMDLAVAGDEGDSFALWDGSSYLPQTSEIRLTPPSTLSPEGFRGMVSDASGAALLIEPGRGQFGDGGEGDHEYLYAVRHEPIFDTSMGVIGGCCVDTYHGPERFVDGEPIADENLALWYVAQMQTDATAPDFACWTVQGEPNPVTYPCFAGPMFVPLSLAIPGAAFTLTDFANVGQPLTFTPDATGRGPLAYLWDFGDGSTSTEEAPTHAYEVAGEYTVTLTVSNSVGQDTATDTILIEVPTAVTVRQLDATSSSTPWLLAAAALALLGVGALGARRILRRR